MSFGLSFAEVTGVGELRSREQIELGILSSHRGYRFAEVSVYVYVCECVSERERERDVSHLVCEIEAEEDD